LVEEASACLATERMATLTAHVDKASAEPALVPALDLPTGTLTASHARMSLRHACLTSGRRDTASAEVASVAAQRPTRLRACACARCHARRTTTRVAIPPSLQGAHRRRRAIRSARRRRRHRMFRLRRHRDRLHRRLPSWEGPTIVPMSTAARPCWLLTA